MPNHRPLLDALLLALRPARWSAFGVRFVPLVLVVVGAWAVVYGSFFHRIPVSETHLEKVTKKVKKEEKKRIPQDPPPRMVPSSPADAFAPPPDAFGPPPEAFGPPKFIEVVQTTETEETVMEPRETTVLRRERDVNQAVTVAGMVRENGKIVVPFRVNANGGAAGAGAAGGPDFCPS